MVQSDLISAVCHDWTDWESQESESDRAVVMALSPAAAAEAALCLVKYVWKHTELPFIFLFTALRHPASYLSCVTLSRDLSTARRWSRAKAESEKELVSAVLGPSSFILNPLGFAAVFASASAVSVCSVSAALLHTVRLCRIMMWWLFAALIVGVVALFYARCYLGPEFIRVAPSVCPVSCFQYASCHAAESDPLLLSDLQRRGVDAHGSFRCMHRILLMVSLLCILTGTFPSFSEMIGALTDCKSLQELESVLLTLDVDLLLDTLAKAQYFVQLCRDRYQLSSLTVKSLARIVCALERHASNQQVAMFVQECLCAKPAKACTALKMEVDQLVSLYDLVFCSIQNKKAREEILTHFDAQALKVKDSGAFVAPVKLISDIDDTIYAAASDSRFPEYTIYPGARQFTAEVLRSSSYQRTAENRPTSEWDKFVASVRQRQCFLTDRPEALKNQIRNVLRQSGFAPVTVLTGNLMNVFGSKWVMSSKIERIKCLVRLFAEFQFVFVGDNAQNDIDLAKVLLTDSQAYPMAAVLIHDVIQETNKRNKTSSSTSSTSSSSSSSSSSIDISHRLSECEDFRIGVFESYVTASFQLFARGILSVEAVGRIIRSTISDLSSTTFASEAQKRSMTKQMMSDISFIVDKLPTNQDAMVLLEGFHERRDTSAKSQVVHKLSVVTSNNRPIDHIV